MTRPATPATEAPARVPGPVDRGVVAGLAFLAVAWGCSFLFIKEAVRGVSPPQVALARLLAGAAVLLLLCAVRRERLPRRRSLWGHLLVVGVTGNVLPFIAFAWGEAHGAPSGLAGVYNATTPLFTVATALLVLPEERPDARRAAGLLVGFAGTVLVLQPWHAAPGARLPGQLACVAGALCYGVSFAYTRRYLSASGCTPLALATGQLVCAAAVATATTPLVGDAPAHLTLTVVLSLLALGVIGSGLAYPVYYRIVTTAGATTASVSTYLVPLVSVLLGVVVLGERPTWLEGAGALVVLAGVAVAERRA